MRFRQLRHFCKIVECGSFSRAAATAQIAQPALSRQIAELETQIGFQLLHRTARGVRATRAGEVLYREASVMLTRLDRTPSLMRSDAGVVNGPVRLGVNSFLGPRLATEIVIACRQELPKVNLKLVVSDSASLRERVRGRDLDLALVYENALSSPPLSRQPLFLQRLYFAPTPSAAAPTEPMSLAQVTEFPLITQSPADITRALLSHALEHARLSVDFVAEVDDVPSLISAIRAGLGGAVLPTANLSTIGGDDLPRPVLIEPPLQLTASIISDSDTPLTRAGDAVRVLLAPLIRRYLDESLPGTEWIGP